VITANRASRFGATMNHRIKQRITMVLKRLMGYERRALWRMRAEDRLLVSRVKSKKLTYLSNTKLESIVNSIRAIEAMEAPGIFVEAGCALGGSTILISSLKGDQRALRVYDVFGMIPPPTEDDTEDVHRRYDHIKQGKSRGIGGDRYYGYESNLYQIVRSNLAAFGIDCEANNVSLIKGLLQDTMTIDQPVAFAHIDVDWYEPVKVSLERIVPMLSVDGCLIVDDYYDWGGCKKAIDEYFRGKSDEFTMDGSSSSLKIVRKAKRAADASSSLGASC
jgi:predicted O-methyltransferase YrrM